MHKKGKLRRHQEGDAEWTYSLASAGVAAPKAVAVSATEPADHATAAGRDAQAQTPKEDQH